MDPQALKQWRKDQRERLVAARLALDVDTLHAFRERIDTHLERAFPGLARGTLAMCWPFKNEYDPRFLAHKLRDRGAKTALPVVVAPRQPLIFRLWKPGDVLAKGVYDIPYPASGDPVAPDIALVPMNGFDAGGYRLGYGGGFFDRTLASLPKKPLVIGIAYDLSKIATIHPQSWDIPVDWIVTERGVYRRDQDKLAFLGEPTEGKP